MTRPSDVKIREGTTPGTPWSEFVIGVALPTIEFTITPEIIAEYMTAVEADEQLYVVDGRPVAPPNVVAVYMTSTVYQKYPPIQGIVMAEVEFDWLHPIWRDESTVVRLGGEIIEKFEKRGRPYVRWQGRFDRADGMPLATIRNAFSLPG
jgi:hypothetical protein